MVRLFIILVFLFSTCLIFGQSLVNIPDANLRSCLSRQGFTTNDSLDLFKIRGLLQLNVSNCNILDLRSLAYFKQVWNLDCSGNSLTELNDLPPNLKAINCSFNQLESLDNLPESLEKIKCIGNELSSPGQLPENVVEIYCGKNKISSISSLPPRLQKLDISNNQITELPALPKTLAFFNFKNNPLDSALLPSGFDSVNCKYSNQNCMPYSRMKWKLFGYERREETSGILSMDSLKITISATHSWGYGREVYRIGYTRKNDNWVTSSSTHKVINRNQPTDSTNSDNVFDKINHGFDHRKWASILDDLSKNDMVFENSDFYLKSSEPFTLDIRQFINVEGLSHICADGSIYYINIEMYTGNVPLGNIQYRFDSCLLILNDGSDKRQHVREILEWLYFWRISNLILPDDFPFNVYFFNANKLDKVVQQFKK